MHDCIKGEGREEFMNLQGHLTIDMIGRGRIPKCGYDEKVERVVGGEFGKRTGEGQKGLCSCLENAKSGPF